MKHTENQILETQQVLKDLSPTNGNTNKVRSIHFNVEEELARGVGIGKPHPCWIIFIDSLFDNTDILTISYESGESLYYQNFNMATIEIKKDANGIYTSK